MEPASIELDELVPEADATTPSEATSPDKATSTLDEPICTTIKRDVFQVWRRMRMVIALHPNKDDMKAELRNWDLLGPLVICMMLSTFLSISAPASQTATVFCAVFAIVWVGAAVVTLNAQLLEGALSFFQTVCVLGYCVFPLCVSALLCELTEDIGGRNLSLIIRATLTLVGFCWCTRSSSNFLVDVVPERRRLLAAYPIGMFYLTIAWMVFIHGLK